MNRWEQHYWSPILLGSSPHLQSYFRRCELAAPQPHAVEKRIHARIVE